MPLNESFLQELKYKTDIEDIVSTYVSLRKRGNTSVGLCPFHNEKTPSFTVYNDTQSFYCFGCGAGGDAIGFIKKIENLDYIDAVKLLAERAGMQMPQDGFDDSISKKRRRILQINREAAKFFQSYLMSPQGKTGYDYFINRGLTPKTIVKFGLGYAPDSWDSLLKHLKSLGYGIGEMVDAGVVKVGRNNNYYDTFKNRVMTPIIDVRGNVIAFGGRVLDDSKPKYVNTSDTLVYKKTNELFALNFAKDSGKDSLILCEGYMDVISMHQAGFNNAVAGCGTALTSEQVRLITGMQRRLYLHTMPTKPVKRQSTRQWSFLKVQMLKFVFLVLREEKTLMKLLKSSGGTSLRVCLRAQAMILNFHFLKSGKNMTLKQRKVKLILYVMHLKSLQRFSLLSRIYI